MTHDVPVLQWNIDPMEPRLSLGDEATVRITFGVQSGLLDDLSLELRGSALSEGLFEADAVSIRGIGVRRTGRGPELSSQESILARESVRRVVPTVDSVEPLATLGFTGLGIKSGGMMPRGGETTSGGSPASIALAALFAPAMQQRRLLQSVFHVCIEGRSVQTGVGDLKVALCPKGGTLDETEYGREQVTVVDCTAAKEAATAGVLRALRSGDVRQYEDLFDRAAHDAVYGPDLSEANQTWEREWFLTTTADVREFVANPIAEISLVRDETVIGRTELAYVDSRGREQRVRLFFESLLREDGPHLVRHGKDLPR